MDIKDETKVYGVNNRVVWEESGKEPEKQANVAYVDSEMAARSGRDAK